MNYQCIYNNFKDHACIQEEQETPFFEKATEEELKNLTSIYEICLADSPVWEEDDLSALKEIMIPAQLVNFYQELNPNNLPMNDAGIYLANLQRIREEYISLEPGCYLVKWGFLVIGTTIGGDPVLLDLKQADLPVYLADHTILLGEGYRGNVDLSFGFPPDALQDEFGDNPIPVTYETIKKCLHLIEKQFDVFIEKMSCNQYPDLEEELLQ